MLFRSAVSSLANGGTASASTPTTVCTGTNSTSLSVTGNTGTIQWQSSTDSTNFNNISGATSTTYTATSLTQKTFFRAVVTSGVCAPANSSTATINVNAASVGGTVAVTTSNPICTGAGNSVTFSLSGQTGSVTKWQWSASSDFSTTVTDVAGTSTTLTQTGLTASRYYRAVVTNGVCAAANSAGALITVSPTSVADRKSTRLNSSH